MRATATLVTCILAFVTAGCEFMPGTEAYRIEQAKRAVAKLLIDPASAQFQNVVARDGYVCGEVNGRNRMGGFVGFKRFLVPLDGDSPLIDPEFDYQDLLTAEDSCEALQSNSYASVSSAIAACRRAEEQRSAAKLQGVFDSSWSKHCSPTGNARVYRPPLSKTQSTNDVARVTGAENAVQVDESRDEGSRTPLVDENSMPLRTGSEPAVEDEPAQEGAPAPMGTGEQTQNELDEAFPPRQR